MSNANEAAKDLKWEDPWIGVDLDGTIAFYDGWRGVDHIGDPIPAMVEKVMTHLAAGNKVKIMTARCCERGETVIKPIEEWCLKHLGVVLEITCIKNSSMIVLYDDRARQVIPNTGVTLEESLAEAKKDRHGFQQFFLDVADALGHALGSTPSVQHDIADLKRKVLDAHKQLKDIQTPTSYLKP